MKKMLWLIFLTLLAFTLVASTVQAQPAAPTPQVVLNTDVASRQTLDFNIILSDDPPTVVDVVGDPLDNIPLPNVIEPFSLTFASANLDGSQRFTGQIELFGNEIVPASFIFTVDRGDPVTERALPAVPLTTPADPVPDTPVAAGGDGGCFISVLE